MEFPIDLFFQELYPFGAKKDILFCASGVKSAQYVYMNLSDRESNWISF